MKARVTVTLKSGILDPQGKAIEGTSLDRAVIFQSHALLPWRTVLGNVAYAVTSKWRNWDRARVKARLTVPTSSVRATLIHSKLLP